MNQENLLLLKELLPAVSLDDILHAYSSYMVVSCIGWLLVVLLTVWSGRFAFKVTKLDDENKLIISGLVGLGVLLISLMVLDFSIKALFPLGALISQLVG